MILTWIEQDRGQLNPASLELLALAGALAVEIDAPLKGVVIGHDATSLAGELAGFGIDTLYAIQSDDLAEYAPAAWAAGLAQLSGELEPTAVMAAGTDRGHEVMAHLAARMELPMAANCTEFRPGDPFVVVRQRWGGSLLEEAELHGSPKLMTTALHVVEPEREGEEAPTVQTFPAEIAEDDLRVQITSREEIEIEGVTLADAPVVVGGGRGVGSAEDFDLLENLAARLGAAVGASRVATNNGWRPHSDQIGQTGTRIAPQLYIACGISGAIQHMVGAKGAKRILVINTDREAPIISKADFAVIGDLHEIVPALIEEIDRQKGD